MFTFLYVLYYMIYVFFSFLRISRVSLPVFSRQLPLVRCYYLVISFFFHFFWGQERPNVGTRPYASVFLTPPPVDGVRASSPPPFLFVLKRCAFCRAKRKEHAFAGSDRLDSEIQTSSRKTVFLRFITAEL